MCDRCCGNLTQEFLSVRGYCISRVLETAKRVQVFLQQLLLASDGVKGNIMTSSDVSNQVMLKKSQYSEAELFSSFHRGLTTTH